MQIEAILFDKDGTLFDFHATWGNWTRAFLLQLADRDKKQAGELGAVIGFDLETGIFQPDSLVVAGTNEDIAGALSEKLPAEKVKALMSGFAAVTYNARPVEAVPLVPLLANLRARGMKLGVATNDNEGPARSHLEAAGIIDFFDFVAGFDSGHGGKPDPGMMLAFAKEMNMAPERVLMVGDSVHDLTAGKAAGMITAGVLTGPAISETLKGHADVVLPDIGYLPSWLDEQYAKDG